MAICQPWNINEVKKRKERNLQVTSSGFILVSPTDEHVGVSDDLLNRGNVLQSGKRKWPRVFNGIPRSRFSSSKIQSL